MTESDSIEQYKFFYPKRRYGGPWTPSMMLFNANLQEFAQRVHYLSNLQTNGKISPHEAFEEISQLWEQLKASKEQLGIDGTGDDTSS